jgi:glutathione synthase/RimK-type ligase-like ATP-grasp enzyme
LSAHIALVTARAARGHDADMPPLEAALAACDARAEITEWDDPHVEWQRFGCALLRSAWDYAERHTEFLAWAARVSQLTRLINPERVVRWNTDKHYLLELARAGVPIVPSGFVEPGEDAADALDRFLARHSSAEVVVKPAIGAGARDSRRHARGARSGILAHMQGLLLARRSLIVQPYLEHVDSAGETALMFIDGAFSHAVRKGPLLPAGAPATAALFAPEEITPRQPAADELEVAQRVVAALPFGTLLYARVDLVREASGRPCVLELEVTEPSMYLNHAPGSATRLAQALLARYVK